MGYTHYWERPCVLPRPQFIAAVEDCRRLCAELNIPLGGADGRGQPIFAASQICFNGHADSGGMFETFQVERVRKPRNPHDQPKKGRWFNFCKTEYRPYDLCVQGCLIVLNHHLGSTKFGVASDGTSEQWNDARAACQRILGYGADWGEGELAPLASSLPA
jgi:hypothetical protein